MFPKWVSPSCMKENFEIFDFALDFEDMNAITALDRGKGRAQWPPSGHVRPRPQLTRLKTGPLLNKGRHEISSTYAICKGLGCRCSLCALPARSQKK